MKISASVACDSVSPEGDRLTTMVLTYPRFIHAEFMTHRVFSRNAASSRAIPTDKLLKMVETNPAMPVRWGLNGKGMQDHGEMTIFGQKRTSDIWLRARDAAVEHAKALLSQKEVPHKQIVNRILEPFMWITVIATSTDWSNFFYLRDHEAADPTFQALAREVRTTYLHSIPMAKEVGDWHLPFIDTADIDDAIKYAINDQPPGPINLEGVDNASLAILLAVSAARCARVSYMNHDGQRSGITEDLQLYGRLIGAPVHASPTEHQACADCLINDTNLYLKAYLHGNFTGWIQARKLIPNEAIKQPKYKGPTYGEVDDND